MVFKGIKGINPYVVDGTLYVKLIIESESNDRIYETEIPQVKLFDVMDYITFEFRLGIDSTSNVPSVDKVVIGDNKFSIMKQPDDALFYTRLMQSKAKKMTMDEIEKELGHKVEIING